MHPLVSPEARAPLRAAPLRSHLPRRREGRDALRPRGGEGREGARRRGGGGGRAAHARVRRARAPARAAGERAGGGRRDRLGAAPRAARAAAGREAVALDADAAARRHPGARRHAAGPRRDARVRARPARRGRRRDARAGAARARRRARAARRAARDAGRAERARARVRTRAGGRSGRRAARRRAGARRGGAAPRPRRAHNDRPRGAARRRRGARGALRRRRRPAAGRRRGAGAGRHRLFGAAAAGLGVQDHHAGGRAGGRRRPSPRASFPVQTAAALEGVELENANGESCGGSLRDSFAHSCNSVFAPMGAELGAPRLVAAAEAFGFNEDPGLDGALPSTIPPAEEIGDDLAVGSSAIGQGRLLATPLQMAEVAGAIATGGVRVQPTLRKGAPARRVRATPAPVARTIGSFMRSVVTDGTGGAAAVPGFAVAGKTGTAELRDSTPEPPPGAEPGAPPPPPPVDDVTDTTRGSPPMRRPASRAWRSR